MSPQILQSLQNALQTANTQALDEISRLAAQTSLNETMEVNTEEPMAIILYRELAYRHLYTKSSPDLNDRIGSFNNYCELFNHILNVELPPLPLKWLYEITDEFIYQFQAFCAFKARTKNNDPELAGIWNVHSVLNVLHSLIDRSQMDDEEEEPNLALFRFLGQYAVIGLTRVHVLLGDYYLALKSMDISRPALYEQVPGAQITAFYYIGFAYLMMGRFSDAMRNFEQILLYLARTRNHSKGALFDAAQKKGEQMYALLAICMALCSRPVDESLVGTMQEKYGTQISRMGNPSECQSAIEELFILGSPKFTAPCVPRIQTRLFAAMVRPYLSGLVSFIKLYTSLSLTKLAELSPNGTREAVMAARIGTYEKICKGDDLLDGDWETAGIKFMLDEDSVQIAKQQKETVIAKWFLTQIDKVKSDLVRLGMQ